MNRRQSRITTTPTEFSNLLRIDTMRPGASRSRRLAPGWAECPAGVTGAVASLQGLARQHPWSMA